MRLVKQILLPLGLLVIAVLSARIALEEDKAVYSTETFSTLIRAVGSDFDANEALADSAPQQQVVAGWATKDYLSVVALQAEETNLRITEVREAEQRNDERTMKLIALGIAAICWVGVWLPFGNDHSQKEPRVEAIQPPLPPPTDGEPATTT